MVDANTRFALDLYHEIAPQPGNLFFSPYAVSTTLAIVYAGAQGKTESEMARVLHFTHGHEDLGKGISVLATHMQNIQRRNRVALLSSSSLWCQEDCLLSRDFVNLVREQYGADIRRVNFETAPEAACSEINAWVDRKTNHKISAVVGPAEIAPGSRLVLCNATYFRAKWAAPVSLKDTKPAPFVADLGKTVTVPMMLQNAELRMIDIDGISLLELPYSGNQLTMVILLPNAEDGLPDLERRLTIDNLYRWFGQLDQGSKQPTVVRLPRFGSTQTIDLAKRLASLGMVSLFRQGQADLSSMTATSSLYISGAIHTAFVQVNEAGTEAAAGSWLRASSKSMTRSFIAYHPFLFFIRESQTGTILFLGRVVDPTKA